MAQAVDAVAGGMSKSEAARIFKIPRTTLIDHTSNGQYFGYDTAFGPAPALNTEEEEALINYTKYMASRGYPLTKKMLRIFGREMMKKEKLPSYGWLNRLLERHPELSLRTPHAIEPDRATLSQDLIDHFFAILEDELKTIDHDKSRLFNVDETGFGGKDRGSRTKVVTQKGVRQAFKVDLPIRGHITVNMCISASGQVLPPLIIFSKNLPVDNYSEFVPGTWAFKSTPSGFMNADLFLFWFQFCKHYGKN